MDHCWDLWGKRRIEAYYGKADGAAVARSFAREDDPYAVIRWWAKGRTA